MANYSIIIKNGTIFDGIGGSSVETDIGIIGDKIKAIGNLGNEKGQIIIDASGKYVCPGFIDITTHSDTHWTIFSQPSQESFIRQGITTIFGGHGGSSLAPLVKPENIESIQKWVDISKININWQSVEEFLNELSNHRFSVNFGTLIGYGTLRRCILDDQMRPAENQEIIQMQNLAEKSFKEGAFGISTNLGAAHENTSTDEEIIELLKVAKKHGVLATHHLEDEGKNILPAMARLISLTRNSGVHSHIAHFKAIGKTAWTYFSQCLEMIERAIKESVKLTCDFFPYTRTGSNLYLLLPDWAREGGKDYIISLIDGEKRKNLIESLKELTLHYEKIIIASTLHDLDAVGKNISELSQNSGMPPEEIILNLLKVNDLQVTIFNEAILEENIELIAKKEYSLVSSDGVGYAGNYRIKNDLPHPRSFGSFPRIFSYFVKNKNILNWESAIYKMTSFPAKLMGLKNRGEIKENFYADVVVFDPEKISDKSDYNNPYQFSEGIDYVLVNGNIAFKEGDLGENFCGRVLRHND